VATRIDTVPQGRLSRGGPAPFISPHVAQGAALRLFLSLWAYLRVLCVAALSFSVSLSAAQTPASSGTNSTAPSPTKSPPATHSAAKKKKKTTPARRQTAPDSARIKEIQQALAREGVYHEEPTGKWDETTADAMKQFQQASGLAPTGKIEALSLQKLGLGSPVAGLAPPDPGPAAPGFAPTSPPRP
jgi:hypothetical protein